MDKKELMKEYDEYYRKKPEKWTSDDRNEYARQIIEDCIEYPPKNFLDIGCGNGHTIKYLKEYWKETAFYGFDLSPEAINVAKAKLPDVDLRVGFLDEMTYSLQFDCISLLGVIEHFENLEGSLKQLYAMLAKDGIIYIEAPNCLSYEGSTPEQGFRRVNFGNRQIEWHLTRESWMNYFRSAGFEILLNKVGRTPQTEFIFVLKK